MRDVHIMVAFTSPTDYDHISNHLNVILNYESKLNVIQNKSPWFDNPHLIATLTHFGPVMSHVNIYQGKHWLRQWLGAWQLYIPYLKKWKYKYPDSKVHGANIGPIWVWQDPDRPQKCPMLTPWTLLSEYIPSSTFTNFFFLMTNFTITINAIPSA